MTTLRASVAEIDLVFLEDQDESFTFTWANSDGTFVDVSSYNAELQMRPSAKHVGSASLELTVGSGITLGATSGTIVCAVTKAVNIFGNNKYVYELKMTSYSGTATRLVAGTIVSRDAVIK